MIAGDRILAVDGQDVSSMPQVDKMVEQKMAGDTVELEIHRKNYSDASLTEKVDVVLGTKNPEYPPYRVQKLRDGLRMGRKKKKQQTVEPKKPEKEFLLPQASAVTAPE